MAWNSQGSLRGTAGAQLRYGNGSPTASNPAIQADGDSYIDVQNGRLFAVRSGGTWPTTYASLIGPTGASVRVGTGSPTSSNPATQADGDVFIQTDALNGPALWGPRSGGTWPGTSTSLAGAAGASFLSGSGAPASSLGTAATPGYYDYANFVIYGPKKSDGTWPAGNSLIGPKGSQFFTDTAPPGLQLGTVGDFFFRSDTYDFYIKVTNAAGATTAQYPNGWLIMANLRGAASTVAGPKGDTGASGSAGSNGLSVVSNAAAPTANDGVVGSPAFINTAAGTLYGAKTSSGWPTTFLSLIGQQGPSGATIYTGSGAPTSTSPASPVANSIYIDSSTQPYRLYGPYSATNGWPTSYIAMGGGSFLTTSGPPSSALGAVGDIAIDITNALFYPPKTSSGWTATPINLVGPTGSTGPTTSYRHSVRGEWWRFTAPTAGTAYPVNNVLSAASQNSSASAYDIELAEPMYAAGSLTAVTCFAYGNAAGTLTLNILKNNSVVYTASNIMTTTSTLARTRGSVVLPSGLTFAAGDYISMTASTSTTTANQHAFFNLFYTTNS